MPRTTNNDYVAAHLRLRELWAEHHSALAGLSPRDQWYLHDYFHFSEHLTRVELLAHRSTISSERPSLPQQAGRALARLTSAAVSSPVRTRSPSGRGSGFIEVGGVVNPQINVDLLLAAVQLIADDQLRRHQQNADDHAA